MYKQKQVFVNNPLCRGEANVDKQKVVLVNKPLCRREVDIDKQKVMFVNNLLVWKVNVCQQCPYRERGVLLVNSVLMC